MEGRGWKDAGRSHKETGRLKSPGCFSAGICQTALPDLEICPGSHQNHTQGLPGSSQSCCRYLQIREMATIRLDWIPKPFCYGPKIGPSSRKWKGRSAGLPSLCLSGIRTPEQEAGARLLLWQILRRLKRFCLTDSNISDRMTTRFFLPTSLVDQDAADMLRQLQAAFVHTYLFHAEGDPGPGIPSGTGANPFLLPLWYSPHRGGNG